MEFNYIIYVNLLYYYNFSISPNAPPLGRSQNSGYVSTQKLEVNLLFGGWRTVLITLFQFFWVIGHQVWVKQYFCFIMPVHPIAVVIVLCLLQYYLIFLLFLSLAGNSYLDYLKERIHIFYVTDKVRSRDEVIIYHWTNMWLCTS